jgi:serine/threonine-protein kinase
MTQQLGADGSESLVGQTVASKYKVTQLLGEGGMGCVYLAEQQLGTNTRKVALKTLHKHLSHDPHIKARFDREAGTVAGLEHPNTIQVFDFGAMPDGTLYLVMEYVQGKSVADTIVAEGPMQPPRVENIMRQVCGSLEEAHGHGIVHRDLKPDNVVLCERAGQKDWVEVLDFGIAKRSSEHDPNEAKLTQQGMVLGTPPYMSPEQFTGQPIDKRSDIYALGVMVYEMLTGQLPWEANTAWEWASKHMTEQPRAIDTQPLGAHVPAKMKAAIEKALSKDREQRQSSAKQFYEELQGGQSGGTAAVAEPVQARAKTEMATPAVGGMMGAPPASMPTPAPYQAQPISAPQPVAVPAGPAHQQPQKGGGGGLVIGLGVLAVLLLGGGGIAWWASHRSKPVVVVPVPTVDTSSPSASAADTGSVAAGDTPPTDSVAPLGGGTTPPPTTPKTSSGGPAHPSAKTVPTPTPPSAKPPPSDPPAAAGTCALARSARAKNSPSAATLEAKCRALGGTP